MSKFDASKESEIYLSKREIENNQVSWELPNIVEEMGYKEIRLLS